VAYDLLLRRQTPKNWSRSSYCGPAARGTLLLASYTFAPDPAPTTDAEKQLLAQLAVLKMRVDNGDKKALKKWRRAMAKLVLAKRAADRGDARARRLVTVVNESGIFAGVQSMSV
jgi:hypothetical protein